MVNEAGVNPTSLDDAERPGSGRPRRLYLARRALIVTRYDLDGLTLAELPGVLASIRDAAVPVDADADPVIAAPERVPEGERELRCRPG